MIEKNVFERCLLYTFVGLSTYFFVKRFFPEKSKYDSEYNLNVKGGDLNPPTGILRLILKDRAIKSSIIAIFATMIGTELQDELVSRLLKSSPAILAAREKELQLNPKVLRILESTELTEMKELLLEKTLTKTDKLKLLKIKIKFILKGLKGKKRTYFIMTLLSLLTFLFRNDTPAFVFFWANLRELLAATNLSEDFD
jgi:hypothetical protein